MDIDPKDEVIYEDIEVKTSKKVGDDVAMDDESEAPAAAIKKLKEKINAAFLEIHLDQILLFH